MARWFSRSTQVAFQIASDLHLEVGQIYKSFNLTSVAPYLVLAGDIGRLQDYHQLLGFLERHCKNFQHLYMVLGNHEFYGLSHQEGLEKATALERESCLQAKFTLLNRTRVNINEKITLLGCTLQSWIPKESRGIVIQKINDFKGRIRNWDVDDHNAEHLLDVQWIKSQLAEVQLECPSRAVVVVTHHAPSNIDTSDPKFANNPWSCAFSTGLIEGEAQDWMGIDNIRFWIFGHTHWTTSSQFGKMQIVSNQRGYNIDIRTPLSSTKRPFWPWIHRTSRKHTFDEKKLIRV